MTVLATRPDRVATEPSQAPAAAKAAPVIVSEGLTVGYKLHRERKLLTALRDISLTVNRGEFVVLVGPSGCGKTTFINAIAGLVEPLGGQHRPSTAGRSPAPAPTAPWSSRTTR